MLPEAVGEHLDGKPRLGGHPRSCFVESRVELCRGLAADDRDLRLETLPRLAHQAPGDQLLYAGGPDGQAAANQLVQRQRVVRGDQHGHVVHTEQGPDFEALGFLTHEAQFREVDPVAQRAILGAHRRRQHHAHGDQCQGRAHDGAGTGHQTGSSGVTRGTKRPGVRSPPGHYRTYAAAVTA